jgi:hypothetical protein
MTRWMISNRLMPSYGSYRTSSSLIYIIFYLFRTIILRLTLALAKTEGVQVNKTHLERTIAVALQFATDLENAFE